MRNLKAQIKAGQKPIGTFVWDYNSPIVCKSLIQAGFDFLLLDQEHGCFGYETVQLMIELAHSAGGEALVRVPMIVREGIQRYCDMGADGIVVPMVDTPEQAQAVVALAHYAPLGRKGMAFGKGNMEYVADGDWNTFVQKSLRDLTILVQAETPQSVQNAKQILAVDGIDGIMIGPLDLSASMGKLGQFEDPDFLAAVEHVLKACKRAGKIACVFAGNERFAERCYGWGCDMVIWSTESSLLYGAAKAAKETIAALAEKT